MEITTEQIKQLRDETGVSIAQCKQALVEANGDADKAREILREKGAASAAKKADRSLGAGAVAAYVHATGTVGALVELRSETDFVSKNEDFRKLAYEIAMHVAAMSPVALRPEDVPLEEVAAAKDAAAAEIGDKPDEIKNPLVEEKMAAYYAERCLALQPFFKNPSLTVGQMIEAAIQKFGEKVEIGRFSRISA
jgi:elongation factor Ts